MTIETTDHEDTFAAGLLQADTLSELFLLRAERSADEVGLIDERGRAVTFAQLREHTARMAAALTARGIGKGSRVAWQLPTQLNAVVVCLALSRLGAIQAPIIAQYRQRELDASIADSQATFLLVPGVWRGVDHVEMGRAVPTAPEVIVIDDAFAESAPALPEPPRPGGDGTEVAWVFFTSGSSGTPKGVLHSDRTLLVSARAMVIRGRAGEDADEVVAMPFPIAHIGGPLQLMSVLMHGRKIVLFEAFALPGSLDALRTHAVTMFGGGPAFYQALLAEQRRRPGEILLPALRKLTGGGAPCPPNLFAEVRDELSAKLMHSYGMTECPMVCVSSPSDTDEQLTNTEGRPVPGLEVRIWADDAIAPAGVPGEVQVRGAQTCLGYANEEHNATAFTADGWFHTGDRAHMRADGYVEVTGRIKDLIIRKGEKIAPQELEQLLAAHPAVAEVAVVGLPDRERGERVCAVIVPRDDAAPPALPDLTDHLLRAEVMRQKLPEQLEIVAELPRRGLSKVDKVRLREQYTR
ncbi:class I adenylate-forming enzyme family protein [Amycolatopsis sp. GM8]|uniref:class I adenylate-forming enzyme family protein n=1 Tax=Amycolatopsis sp. GM8 TaxID=2896530 RepID=UPI001F1A152F|nr:class I adenylate-forming enzyme family protein [Amycolatopsis sp. GM8]